MNFAKTIISELQQNLTEQKESKAPGRNYTFTQTLRNINFEFVLKDFDSYSFLFEKIGVKLHETNLEALRKHADLIKERVTYLLENLETYEEDSVNEKIQLRSNLEDGAKTINYYEITLNKSGFVAIERFHFDRKRNKREKVSFQLTVEVLEKLLNDFIEVMQN